MKIINVFLILLFFITGISAKSNAEVLKNDSAFYKYENGFITACQRSKANGYSLPQPKSPEMYVHRIYYLNSDILMAAYEMYDKESSNARKNVMANFPVKNGKYEEWYISGEKRVTCFYTEDNLNGEFKVFYQNGNVKRLEHWKMGEWQDGECFDELGNKTDYCSYQEMADFIGGTPALFKFIARNLVYPIEAKKAGIQGKVFVSFVIASDGSITDVKVVRGVDFQLNEEAVRIVNKMPKWKPTRFEGKTVSTQFTIPIIFKLE